VYTAVALVVETAAVALETAGGEGSNGGARA